MQYSISVSRAQRILQANSNPATVSPRLPRNMIVAKDGVWCRAGYPLTCLRSQAACLVRSRVDGIVLAAGQTTCRAMSGCLALILSRGAGKHLSQHQSHHDSGSARLFGHCARSVVECAAAPNRPFCEQTPTDKPPRARPFATTK